MRVLLVSIYDTARSGGLSTHVVELAAGLRESGHEAVVSTPYTEVAGWLRRVVVDLPRLPMQMIDRDAAYRHFLGWGRRLLTAAVRRQIRGGGIGLIHAHDPVALLSARDALGSGARVPLVLTVHGDIANLAASDGRISATGRGRTAAEALEREAYRRADLLIAVDNRLSRHCRTIGGERDVEVFPNFVDVGRLRPETPEDGVSLRTLRSALGLGDRARVILCPRRLVPKNGVIYAVRALAEPRLRGEAREDVVLLIAGRGQERPRIAAEVRRLGLDSRAGDVERGPRVRLLGDVPRAALPEFYRLAEIVLVPSIPDAGVVEATSLTAIEAMASARPVIASAIGGLAELIESGRTGVLVPPGDSAAIANATADVLDDPVAARAIGGAARETVVRRHSTSACVARLLSLYAAIGAMQ